MTKIHINGELKDLTLMERVLWDEYYTVVRKYHNGNLRRANTFATRVIQDKLTQLNACQGETFIIVGALILQRPWSALHRRSTLGDVEMSIGVSYHGQKFSAWRYDFTDLKHLRFDRR